MVDIQAYIQQLYQYIQHQEKRISRFEKAMKELKTEVQALKEKPPISVERLEYKFDQLKIERLDGTLNIGLNPSDLSEKIEDMEIPPPNTQGPSIVADPNFKQEIINRLNHYVGNEIHTVINDTEQQLGMNLEQHYHDFIVNDLHKQIPQRVDHYLNILAGQNLGTLSKEDLLDQVYQKMKADIDQAIFLFISKLPNNMNGGNTNGT
ncbi:spore germination protein GerPC [Bacillus sp. FJAT-49736]|uniref:spore germination protein GerPC n=1 Tax=Bacillus sp. FJAT-49736 TaxID=2833582 RepID=UPI001BC9CB2D|nr:spore germination protein GerPC [Bacillus sp. FJAT-49736]MBS4172011.1 spore gernimation protein [Bacillus sp. FJAT-49736]